MRTGIATAAALLCLVLAGTVRSEGQAPSTVPAAAPAAPAGQSTQPAGSAPVAAAPSSSQRALVDQYCVGCHSERMRAGGLVLAGLNLDAVDQNAEIAEKVIRKLRGGLMPPAGSKRPDSQAVAAFVSSLEKEIDTFNAAPSPGRVP